MRVKRLVKYFTFGERDRADVTLGPDTRLSFEDQDIRLIEDLTDGFPTDDDLFVRSKLANPLSVKQWAGFDVMAINAKDNDGNDLTSVAFKLSDGTDDYYWDGGSWTIAGVSDWSPEVDIANNISTFPHTEKKLQIVINLKTTDSSVTPIVKCIKVLYHSDVEFQDDLIYRSLIPELKEQIRPFSRLILIAPTTTDTVNLDSASLDIPYTVLDVDSVFNYDTDPGLCVDLLTSYDSGTEDITLTSSVAAGTNLYVKFVYEPVIAVRTSQDYIEAGRIPAITLRDITLVETAPQQKDQYVGNKDTAEAVVVPAPLRGDLEITARILTDKDVENHVLSDELKRFFGNNKFLRSRGLDETYRLWLMEEFGDVTDISQKELHTSEVTFRIMGVFFWYEDARDDYIILRSPQFNMNQR